MYQNRSYCCCCCAFTIVLALLCAVYYFLSFFGIFSFVYCFIERGKLSALYDDWYWTALENYFQIFCRNANNVVHTLRMKPAAAFTRSLTSVVYIYERYVLVRAFKHGRKRIKQNSIQNVHSLCDGDDFVIVNGLHVKRVKQAIWFGKRVWTRLALRACMLGARVVDIVWVFVCTVNSVFYNIPRAIGTDVFKARFYRCKAIRDRKWCVCHNTIAIRRIILWQSSWMCRTVRTQLECFRSIRIHAFRVCCGTRSQQRTHIHTQYTYIHASSIDTRTVKIVQFDLSFWILTAIHQKVGEITREKKRKTYCKNHTQNETVCTAAEQCIFEWTNGRTESTNESKNERNEVVKRLHPHTYRMNEYAWQEMRMRISNRTNSRQSRAKQSKRMKSKNEKEKKKQTRPVWKYETIQNFRQA